MQYIYNNLGAGKIGFVLHIFFTQYAARDTNKLGSFLQTALTAEIAETAEDESATFDTHCWMLDILVLFHLIACCPDNPPPAILIS